MKSTYRLGKEELLEKLNYYINRKKLAEEKGFLGNPKYKSIITELNFRINELKNILLCIDVLPNHMTDIGELFKYMSSVVNQLFKTKAGHDGEENMLKAALDKAIDQKHTDIWNDINSAMELFDKDYSFENKLQLHVDLINYLVRNALFFIAYREIICKIDP
jgi:hypothetical protein